MNASDKAKYQKAKYIVKKWENEFKKTTGHIPAKADIKEAPSRIKDAYRTYWQLKTQTIENTLLDITLDENAKDAFNLSFSSDTEPKKDSSQNFTAEDSQCFRIISDITSDLTCDSQTQNSHSLTLSNEQKQGVGFGGSLTNDHIITKDLSGNKNNLSFQNSKTVWGEHLSKKCEEKPKPPSQIKSISSIYAQKLFQGSKFNKRNPRKPRKFDRPKPVPSSDNPESLNSNIDDKQQVCGENSKASETLVSHNRVHQEDDSTKEQSFDIINEKHKIIIKSTPQNSYHGVSILQKTFSESARSKSLSDRSINQGWLNRLADANSHESEKERCSFDSGIDVKDLNASKGDSFTEVEQVKCQRETVDQQSEDSGEDLICDSDSESQAASQCKINLFNFPLKSLTENSLKNSFSNPVEREPMKRKFEELKETDITAAKKPKLLSENISKELNVRNLEDTIDISTGDASKSLTQKKMEVLEKKVMSGKANENFVRINIQKKVYTRGKKKTTFSNFKKQKWKAMKKKSGGYSGVNKCFKCGDVGHFASDCRQGSKDEADIYEFEDESPLPTLEEAEDMAKDAAEKVHSRKRLRTNNTQVIADVDNESAPMPIICEPPSVVSSFFSTNSDGTLIETPELVYEALREFGHKEFRVGQEEAIMRILSGLSTLVTLSTGTGKSLCYQLPAYIYSKHRNCITLVVSPLVSLMEDQVFCGASCLRVACLHTNLTPKQREVVMGQLKDGSLSVLLVSPEALASGDRMASSFLRHLPPVAFACVDEAHCVSQWSHNFRPSYLTVCQVLREKLGVKTILGLTATATVSTIRSILDQFGVPKDDPNAVISDVPLPKNLLLSVSMDEDRDCALLTLLASERFSNCSSIIVYCTRREQCDKLAVLLRTALQDGCSLGKAGRLSIHAEAYHAGLSAARRKQVQKHFMTGKLRIVVATVAFGMGINKNDIRAIIHYNMPSTFESYVQEIGRAGRDRLDAHCHLFLDSKGGDISELKRHIYSNTVDRHTIRKLLQMVFVPCKCEGPCIKHEVAFAIDETVTALDMPQENIQTLLCYLELHETKWIQVLSPAYTKCKITCYKGDRLMKQTAKTCPPLAMALAMMQNSDKGISKLEFDIIKLARLMKWDSGIVKHTLKNLEWITDENGSKKSGIVVEYSVLGFRILSTGNLNEDELDSALDILHNNVLNHERQSLYQLHSTYNALKMLSHRTVNECSESIDMEKCEKLKTIIRNYFTTEETVEGKFEEQEELENEDDIVRDIRQMICTYSDRSFNGRNIARIFHGIGSPNFTPLMWGRTRFWRAHLNQNFNLLYKLATKQLILMR